ncbi:MAG TPA: alpha/beta fold hydrolase, partial [Xanthobacteraceae bacterium]|nr:alpha/beta fold hydrolase [Xanthobacteraceae bacterium]
MSIITVDGCAFNVEIAGVPDKPALMLSNSLGADLHMWDAQAEALARDYRLIRYDRRGHGASAVTPGPYTMEQLGHDALGILDALGIAQVNWCGLSMGGMVGMWLLTHAPERIDRAVLANTSAHMGPPDLWNGRIALAREGGMEATVEPTVKRWFPAAFHSKAPAAIERMRDMIRRTSLAGYIGCCEAIRDMDQRESL